MPLFLPFLSYFPKMPVFECIFYQAEGQTKQKFDKRKTSKEFISTINLETLINFQFYKKKYKKNNDKNLLHLNWSWVFFLHEPSHDPFSQPT